MEENLNKIKERIESQISKIQEMNDLDKFKSEILGKKCELTQILKNMKNYDENERRKVGKAVNDAKNNIEAKIEEKREIIKKIELSKRLEKIERVDFSLPVNDELGSLHPITVVQREIEEIFRTMGFTVEDGNEVETEYNNFEAVNVPKYHPARDMQDTYWLENGQLLKTQTSAAQNRIMKKYGAPLKAIFPGRCFRNESLDASHENTFFQLEGMMIDENISVANLIYFMKTTLSEIFKKDLKVRLRPGFFPFVEPGFELDVSCMYCNGKGCKVCKHGGWIELCPCGLIHPNVLEMGGIDPEKYSGFAFGLGLSRLSMMIY